MRKKVVLRSNKQEDIDTSIIEENRVTRSTKKTRKSDEKQQKTTTEIDSLNKMLGEMSCSEDKNDENVIPRYRNEQYTVLMKLLSPLENQKTRTTFLHCFGPKSAGKSTTVMAVLRKLKYIHTLVDVSESCDCVRLLLNEILVSLLDDQETEDIDNMNTFIIRLEQLIERKQWNNKPIVIVLEKAERLRNMPNTVFSALRDMDKFVKEARIVVVTVSSLPWKNLLFFHSTASLSPVQIQFPNYTKEELQELLKGLILNIDNFDIKEEYSNEIVESYIQVLLDTFFILSRDLQELSFLATENWESYIQPIRDGWVGTKNNKRELWRLIRPILRSSFNRMFIRGSESTNQFQLDIPYYGKYMLIAAYLASYNPPGSDRRFFVKNQGKSSQRRQWAMNFRDRDSSHSIGPKPFAFERLIRIFYAIVENKKFVAKQNLFGQISTLVSTGFFAQISASGNLDTPKFRCMADLDTVSYVARSVDFDIHSYLYDFVRQ